MLKQFNDVIRRKKTRLNTRLAVFSFFLVIAIILWYLNKLTNEYTTELLFPVKIVNQPKGKVIVGEPVKELSLRVTAFGYNLLPYKIGSSLLPITIDLNQSILTPIPGTGSRSYILTSRLRHSISSQLSGDFQLESILPDTIIFEFTTLVEKKVKVKPNLQVNFERQFMQAGLVVTTPDSIIISGPKSIIDTINQVTTLPIIRSNLFENTDLVASLPVIKQVGFSHRKVHVMLPVEKFTEAKIDVPIEAVNVPSDIAIKLMPSIVTIKCNVVLSQYTTLNSKQFSVQVDYNSVDQNSGNRLRVNVTRKPDKVQRYDFEPKYVEYLIEKMQ